MKTINRLLLLLILTVAFFIVAKVTNVFEGWGGQNKITVERSVVDFGREIFGNKISIRDNITIRQKGNLYVDGNFLGLGNENKEIEIVFMSELGYFVKDIGKSERVDSLKGDKVINRTLYVELPLPDTLSFIEMRQEEKSNEWFWEGWYKDNQNYDAREEFLDKMKSNAYDQFVTMHISPEKTTSLHEAAYTVLNFVNNGFNIGSEIGFDEIVATFIIPDGNTPQSISIICDKDGNCVLDKMSKTEFLN